MRNLQREIRCSLQQSAVIIRPILDDVLVINRFSSGIYVVGLDRVMLPDEDDT